MNYKKFRMRNRKRPSGESALSPALPGKLLTITSFKKWITDAKQQPTYSIHEAKALWGVNGKSFADYEAIAGWN